MTRRRAVLLAVALTAALASIAAPASAKGLAGKTVPGAPTITSVTPGHKSLIVAFTPPATTGGTPILGYRARCRPKKGGETKWSSAHKSPIHVSSVADGKSYACIVVARNRVGFGPASAPFKFTASGTT